ncbi:hypothetical protein RRF57_010532 [Xylaria bambusicola]|uniref:Uncharacterized protein n=1 Tax=Xylaria bambusicola TaxID=326684 RepID=A0AAN7V3Q7_9PEZI
MSGSMSGIPSSSSSPSHEGMTHTRTRHYIRRLTAEDDENKQTVTDGEQGSFKGQSIAPSRIEYTFSAAMSSYRGIPIYPAKRPLW